MPWNGSGTFNRTDGARTGVDVFDQQRAAGVDPTAPLFDAVSQDLADGLENCLTRTGETSPTAATPWNNQKITGLANGTAAADAVNKAQLDAQSAQFVAAASVGGSANAIELTPTTAITAYAAGQAFRFIVEAANTDAVTVAVSGLSAQSLTKSGSTPLESGDLTVGSLVLITYDGTRFQLISGAGGGTFSINGLGTTITGIADDDEFALADLSSVNNDNVKAAASSVKQYCLGGTATNIVLTTEAAYDNLATKHATTLYFFTG